MLEVLIAALILGIGVLGFASMQVRAINTTGQSHLRAQAAVLAADLAERARMVMMANDYPGCLAPPAATPEELRLCVRAALVDLWATAEAPPAGLPSAWAQADETCIFIGAFNGAALANRCATADVLARADMLEMRFLVDQLLPAGTLDLRACEAGGPLICIYVGWRGIEAADDDECALGGDEPDCLAMRVLL